jgi:Superfamily I DNA and RNA helicases
MRISDLQRIAHQDSARNGWYDGPPRNLGEMICLMHSELSEVMETLRKPGEDGKPKPSDKIEGFTSEEEEMADVVIRIADYAEYRGLRLEDAISAKLAANRKRGYKHGGKKF